MTEVEEAILEELRAHTRWLRLIALPALRITARNVLDTPRKRAVYELTTGERTIREISNLTGTSIGAISGYWAEWEQAGLVSKSDRRFTHVGTLSSLGLSTDTLDVPRDTD
jgi:hypothetical protein